MTQLARYWNCDGQPRFYHHTGAVSNYYGLREALSEYAAEESHQVRLFYTTLTNLTIRLCGIATLNAPKCSTTA